MDQIVQVARLPQAGETVLASGSVRLVPGGKGANQAVAMARLGASVRMAGRVGRDAAGTQFLELLRREGIDSELVIIDEQEASGTAFIVLEPGENMIVVAGGANMRVGEDEQEMQNLLAALPAARALVLQMEIPARTVSRLAEAAQRAGVPVILNLAPATELPLETLRCLEALIVNETEAAALMKHLPARAETAGLQGLETYAAQATHIQRHGPASVVITLGEQGAILASQGATVHIHAPVVSVVDPTAAGDCFVGAFTVALTEGQTREQALRFAVQASALKVTTFGAQPGLPTRAEVENFLAAH
jgi:ribokinase